MRLIKKITESGNVESATSAAVKEIRKVQQVSKVSYIVRFFFQFFPLRTVNNTKYKSCSWFIFQKFQAYSSDKM